MSTIQPEALRLAADLQTCAGPDHWDARYLEFHAAAELRRQHADLAHADRYAEQLGHELAKAGAEIADLRAQLASIGAGGVAPLMGAEGELRSALSAMLTHMGMDEDEWNKPTFDQARRALRVAPPIASEAKGAT